MALLIKPDGTEEIVKSKGRRWTITEWQTLIGGYVEKMPGIQQTVLFDEDGKRKHLDFNQKATERVLLLLSGMPLRYVPQLVGPVLFLTPEDKV
jgi:hypothetical protein